MFDQTFVNTHAQTRKPWTVAGSLALQTGLVAALLILPLLHPEIPKLKLEAPPRPYVKLTTEQPPEPKTIQRVARPRIFTGPLTAPRNIPPHAGIVEDAPSIADYAIPGAFSSADTGTGTGFSVGLPVVPTKPAPVVKAPPEPPAAPARISLGVNVARLIFAPRPQYPAIAKAARVQGTVKLQAVISADGSVQNLQLMSGSPLLTGAALDAVRQWRYQPTLLSGKPVEVLTEIDVVFTLSQ